MSLKNNINSLNSNFSFDNYKIYLSISVGGNFYAAMESNIKIAEAAEHNRMFLEKFNDKKRVFQRIKFVDFYGWMHFQKEQVSANRFTPMES